TSAASGTANAHSLITLPEHAAEYIFAVWALIVTVLFARIGVGFWQLRNLKRTCVPLDESSFGPQVRASLLASPRRAVLCSSDRVGVPTALGLASPAKIVIPTWLVDQLSLDELHHLVLHELAHLRRCDDWTNLAQRILGALFFFHPAMWWLQHRLALEREMACDECVLAQTGNARAYARSLANIAERSFVRRTVALAQAAVSRLHDTTLRVAKILSPAPTRRSAVPLVASVAAIGGLTIAVAVYSPDLVSFTQPTAPTMIATAQPANLSTVEPQPLKPIMASLPTAPEPRAPRKKAPKSLRPAKPSAELASNTPPAETAIPAKATLDQKAQLQHPAVLLYWQETYRDHGMIVQRTFWRVVVFQNPIPKEQPQKNI
ncbi:MAG TPA: M56 family metallopeptidase, partial [Terriglobales bacterium]|nr:M56 family metallopeptidase [Terriglobales bacterium]